MARVIAFDVNETLLDLAPLDPVFERAFGNAELRRQWFSLMLLLAFVGGLTGRYVDFTRAQRAALSMLAEAYGIALDADMSRTSSSSTPAAGSAPSIALTVREWFAPRKIRGVALARARYTRR
jgi:hypothetical protein